MHRQITRMEQSIEQRKKENEASIKKIGVNTTPIFYAVILECFVRIDNVFVC